MEPTDKKPKYPKTLGGCVDLYFKTRETRLKIQKEIDRLEALEKGLKEHLISGIHKDDGGAVGRIGRCERYTDTIPRAAEWPKIYAFIKRTGSFDLLQKRLNDKAVQDRWDDKKIIPGIEAFKLVKLSFHKL